MPLVVVGSVNADILLSGIARLPSAGETVAATTLAHQFGGKGANQAAVAASIGADVTLIAAVGADAAGDAALDDLRGLGVDTGFVRRSATSPTGTAVVAVDAHGENLIVIAPGANAEVDGADAGRVLARGRGIVLACLEIPLAAVLSWARAARAAGWTLVLNPAPAPVEPLSAELLGLVDVLVPNEHEFAQLSGAEGLFAAGVGAVVVTRGARGALVRTSHRSAERTAFPVAARDTTGAGDAFCAGLATALAEGLDLYEAVDVAAACGALATRGPGARGSLPTRREVDALLAGERS
ncbi:ribokinase [Microbacterium ulmi]|uniref:Ribokinase n=1 Tax=Microbacterium ulmi TaxID=179095 RepID=A0A7Y2LZJ3_9MICO|nr:ribokinase [Microbacterium ulmi]NII69164.1 ribokinase [Microbacterium ulmi]NNH03704.1 ribokinase [Microbacterium ulmi]